MTWIQNFDEAIKCEHDDIDTDDGGTSDSRCKICGTWAKDRSTIFELKEILAENPNEIINPDQYENDYKPYTTEMVEKIRSLYK